ncbi:serine-rich adhesin for platelets-like isoform X2 [Anthonomus grandis grandis]|uniref:serine-rich adhesin for platelets-like isoform X2 n=1 Tax=Anthonomus grandis grandis TaxID=2921223 RepID=UPI002165106F|nr:serine-rich adhesin for platelets-like isoform X2 [Anthonomus grandis grandis]
MCQRVIEHALVFLFVWCFIVGNASSLKCEICRGYQCFRSRIPTEKCSNNYPSLPVNFPINPVKVKGKYEYGCLSLKYFQDNSTYRIRQCLPVVTGDCICKQFKNTLHIEQCTFQNRKITRRRGSSEEINDKFCEVQSRWSNSDETDSDEEDEREEDEDEESEEDSDMLDDIIEDLLDKPNNNYNIKSTTTKVALEASKTTSTFLLPLGNSKEPTTTSKHVPFIIIPPSTTTSTPVSLSSSTVRASKSTKGIESTAKDHPNLMTSQKGVESTIKNYISTISTTKPLISSPTKIPNFVNSQIPNNFLTAQASKPSNGITVVASTTKRTTPKTQASSIIISLSSNSIEQATNITKEELNIIPTITKNDKETTTSTLVSTNLHTQSTTAHDTDVLSSSSKYSYATTNSKDDLTPTTTIGSFVLNSSIAVTTETSVVENLDESSLIPSVSTANSKPIASIPESSSVDNENSNNTTVASMENSITTAVGATVNNMTSIDIDGALTNPSSEKSYSAITSSDTKTSSTSSFIENKSTTMSLIGNSNSTVINANFSLMPSMDIDETVATSLPEKSNNASDTTNASSDNTTIFDDQITSMSLIHSPNSTTDNMIDDNSRSTAPSTVNKNTATSSMKELDNTTVNKDEAITKSTSGNDSNGLTSTNRVTISSYLFSSTDAEKLSLSSMKEPNSTTVVPITTSNISTISRNEVKTESPFENVNVSSIISTNVPTSSTDNIVTTPIPIDSTNIQMSPMDQNSTTPYSLLDENSFNLNTRTTVFEDQAAIDFSFVNSATLNTNIVNPSGSTESTNDKSFQMSSMEILNFTTDDSLMDINIRTTIGNEARTDENLSSTASSNDVLNESSDLLSSTLSTNTSTENPITITTNSVVNSTIISGDKIVIDSSFENVSNSVTTIKDETSHLFSSTLSTDDKSTQTSSMDNINSTPMNFVVKDNSSSLHGSTTILADESLAESSSGYLNSIDPSTNMIDESHLLSSLGSTSAQNTQSSSKENPSITGPVVNTNVSTIDHSTVSTTTAENGTTISSVFDKNSTSMYTVPIDTFASDLLSDVESSYPFNSIVSTDTNNTMEDLNNAATVELDINTNVSNMNHVSTTLGVSYDADVSTNNEESSDKSNSFPSTITGITPIATIEDPNTVGTTVGSVMDVSSSNNDNFTTIVTVAINTNMADEPSYQSSTGTTSSLEDLNDTATLALVMDTIVLNTSHLTTILTDSSSEVFYDEAANTGIIESSDISSYFSPTITEIRPTASEDGLNDKTVGSTVDTSYASMEFSYVASNTNTADKSPYQISTDSTTNTKTSSSSIKDLNETATVGLVMDTNVLNASHSITISADDPTDVSSGVFYDITASTDILESSNPTKSTESSLTKTTPAASIENPNTVGTTVGSATDPSFSSNNDFTIIANVATNTNRVDEPSYKSSTASTNDGKNTPTSSLVEDLNETATVGLVVDTIFSNTSHLITILENDAVDSPSGILYDDAASTDILESSNSTKSTTVSTLTKTTPVALIEDTNTVGATEGSVKDPSAFSNNNLITISNVVANMVDESSYQSSTVFADYSKNTLTLSSVEDLNEIATVGLVVDTNVSNTSDLTTILGDDATDSSYGVFYNSTNIAESSNATVSIFTKTTPAASIENTPVESVMNTNSSSINKSTTIANVAADTSMTGESSYQSSTTFTDYSKNTITSSSIKDINDTATVGLDVDSNFSSTTHLTTIIGDVAIDSSSGVFSDATVNTDIEESSNSTTTTSIKDPNTVAITVGSVMDSSSLNNSATIANEAVNINMTEEYFYQNSTATTNYSEGTLTSLSMEDLNEIETVGLVVNMNVCNTSHSTTISGYDATDSSSEVVYGTVADTDILTSSDPTRSTAGSLIETTPVGAVTHANSASNNNSTTAANVATNTNLAGEPFYQNATASTDYSKNTPTPLSMEDLNDTAIVGLDMNTNVSNMSHSDSRDFSSEVFYDAATSTDIAESFDTSNSFASTIIEITPPTLVEGVNGTTMGSTKDSSFDSTVISYEASKTNMADEFAHHSSTDDSKNTPTSSSIANLNEAETVGFVTDINNSNTILSDDATDSLFGVPYDATASTDAIESSNPTKFTASYLSKTTPIEDTKIVTSSPSYNNSTIIATVGANTNMMDESSYQSSTDDSKNIPMKDLNNSAIVELAMDPDESSHSTTILGDDTANSSMEIIYVVAASTGIVESFDPTESTEPTFTKTTPAAAEAVLNANSSRNNNSNTIAESTNMTGISYSSTVFTDYAENTSTASVVASNTITVDLTIDSNHSFLINSTAIAGNKSNENTLITILNTGDTNYSSIITSTVKTSPISLTKEPNTTVANTFLQVNYSSSTTTGQIPINSSYEYEMDSALITPTVGNDAKNSSEGDLSNSFESFNITTPTVMDATVKSTTKSSIISILDPPPAHESSNSKNEVNEADFVVTPFSAENPFFYSVFLIILLCFFRDLYYGSPIT